MGQPAFSVHRPAAEPLPIIVEIPHAGLDVPAPFGAELVAPVRSLARDADLYVDDLFAEAAEEGATTLVAHVSRYVTDLNRAEHDVDALAAEGGSPELRMPRGVVWRLTSDGEPALPRPLSRDAFIARLDAVYRPYHLALEGLIDEMRDRFGFVVVLAAHSMPTLQRQRGALRPLDRADIVPGTQGRTTADAALIDAVAAHATQAGLSVRHDDPYRGGFVTRHHGRPSNGVHAVQIEIARRLYMDEVSLRRSATYATMRAWCRSLIRSLAQSAENRGASLRPPRKK